MLAFGIIAAFIAYYVSLSELLASEPEAVSTVLPIGASKLLNFSISPFAVHFLGIKYHDLS